MKGNHLSSAVAAAVPSSPRPIIVTDRRAGREGLRTFRDAMADICSPSLCDSAGEFEATSRSCDMGAAVLTDVQSCPLRYERSALQVARSGYDHFQINLILAGDMQLSSGRQTTVFRRGDIGIFDTDRATDMQVRGAAGGLSHCMSIFIPRTMIASSFASPDDEHGAVLRREVRAGRMLGDLMVSLAQKAGQLTPTQTDVQLRGLLGLLAGGLDCATDASLPLRQAMRMAARASAERYIDKHLDSSRLSADALARRFGWSRATLYRLFEPDGGLMKYIQRRRLQRAYAALVSPVHAHRRVLDIALDSHFASDATFNRAFRRTYGVPPGELRELSRALHAAREHRAPAIEGGSLAVHWIQQLTQPPPVATG
jgi:AraC-like DNA-binding protein